MPLVNNLEVPQIFEVIPMEISFEQRGVNLAQREAELNETIRTILNHNNEIPVPECGKNVDQIGRGVDQVREQAQRFILKNLRAYSGKEPDTLESWVLQAKSLMDSSALDESTKVKSLLLRLDGHARELVENLDIKTVDSILKTLTETYGKDKNTMIANTKQGLEETPRMFLGRLRTGFFRIGIKGEVADEFLMGYSYLLGKSYDHSTRARWKML